MALVAVLAVQGSSQAVTLPAELELDAPSLLLSADGATLRVRISPDVEAGWLRMTAIDPERPVPELAVKRDADRLAVVASPQGTAENVLVEAVLTATQHLAIEGSGLDVSVEGGGGEVEELEVAAPGTAAARPGSAPAVELRVVDSRLELNGLSGLVMVIEGGSARLSETSGALEVEATDASTSVEDHRGPLTLTARGGEAGITRQTGQLQLGLTAAAVEIFGGQGPVVLEEIGGFVRLEDRRGKLELSASGSTLELLRLPGPITLQGAQTTALVEAIGGSLDTTMTSGQLEGRNLGAAVKLAVSDGASVRLEGLASGAVVKSEQSDTRLRGVAGSVKSEVHGGTFEVADVERLDLVAVEARVVASDVRRLQSLDLTDTQFELDLETLLTQPHLQLKGLSDGTVYLAPPCYVRLLDRQGLAETRVRLSGCEFDTPARRSRRVTNRLDGSRTTLMTVEMSAEATVEIIGSP